MELEHHQLALVLTAAQRQLFEPGIRGSRYCGAFPAALQPAIPHLLVALHDTMRAFCSTKLQLRSTIEIRVLSW